MKTKTDDNQSGNSIVRGLSDSGLDVMEGEKYMIDTKERIARSNIYSIFGKLMNNQAAGRIEDDEIYDNFVAFLAHHLLLQIHQ